LNADIDNCHLLITAKVVRFLNFKELL